MKQIREALDVRLAALAKLQGLPVAWENVDFTPPQGEYWRAFLLPGEASAVGLGTEAHNFHPGVYQVDIMVPAGDGWGKASLSAERIIARFKRGDLIQTDDASITITRSYSGPGMREDGRYKMPVTIGYRAVISNE